MIKRAIVCGAVFGGALTVLGCGGSVSSESGEESTAVVQDALSTATASPAPNQFFIPTPDPGAVKQAAALLRAGDLRNALRIAAMVTTPQAVWLTGGTPAEVQATVKKTMAEAAAQRRVPVLVAYNVPFRDCAQFSAGGAADTAAYKLWIDAFAKGIGKGKAVVIVEPDGLGIIPWNTTIFGAADWCKPTVTAADGSVVPAPGATPDERYAQLQYAGASLLANAPNAAAYLDGTHSAWLGVGEAAYRLHRAGTDPVTQASLTRGFFLNTSNFQTTEQAELFGTWVSMCTAFATDPEEGGWRVGNFGWCAGQYNPATGYQLDYTPAYTATVTAQIQGLMGTSVATLPFVIDTSRNARGPFDASAYAAAPFNQPASVVGTLNAGNWCNPPSAGLGPRPTSTTGIPLVDAFLWVKTPGQSDGSCDIGSGVRAWDYSQYNPWGIAGDAQNHFDPLWGVVDPAAGAWFPQQALKLAQQAVPPLF